MIVDHGPASERGWLAMRAALGFGLGGHSVSVFLFAEGAGWALPVDARAWLGGDPGKELSGLVEDAGAVILVDEESLGELGPDAVAGRRTGITSATRADFDHTYGDADIVVCS